MSWWDRLSPHARRRAEIDAEIEAHLDLEARRLIDQGMDAATARREAEQRFGELAAARRRLYSSARQRDRRLRRAHRLESIAVDLRAGLRRLRHDPLASGLAVVTFALGIGLTTATFSVVDHVLLRPLPFSEPDGLVALHSVPEAGDSFPYVSATNWLDWQEQNRTLESTAIYSILGNSTVVTADDAFTVPAKYVSGRFFDVLRTPFAAGRPFTPEEVRDREAVAVVSEGFWRRVLSANPELPVTLSIDGSPTLIIGVVAAGYEHPQGTQMWHPGRWLEYQGGAARNNVNWYAVARLAPGISIEAARADLSSIADGIRAADPAGIYSYGVGVVALKDEVVGDADETLLVALGCVLAVLLVSCANLAGLEFSRRSARAHESAVRAALGASRWRMVQHGVLEQVALAVLGGALGAALAWWGTNAMLTRYELPVPRAEAVAVDLRVLAFALVVSVLSGVMASVLPSVIEGRVAPGRAMAGRRGAVRGGRNLPGAVLVGAEVALAVVLLVACGLLARNFLALVGRDLGFNPEGVVTADIALTAQRYRAGHEVRLQYWSNALDTLAAIPGVTATAAGNPIPTGVGGRGFVLIEEQPDVEAGADYRVVSHDYFDLLEVPLLAGRLFDATDGATSERVTIINRAMAEAYWPDANPVGERIQATSQESLPDPPSLLIIGVVGDLRQYGFSDDLNTAMYVLHEQVPAYSGGMTLMARAAGGPEAITSVVRERLRELDGNLAIDVATLDARLGGRVAGERLLATTLALFAALGLALAAIGIYGLLSFAVGQRTREIAVRMAVGARAADVVGMIARNALAVVALGLVAGLWLAYGFRRFIGALLVDVPAGDPATYVVVVAVVLLAGGGAALLPALRAVRSSPLETLRQA